MHRCLERVWEVHWKALSVAATLEKEMKRLHQIRCHSQSEVRPKSQHHQRSEGMWQERCHWAGSASKPTPSQSTNPDTSPGEMEPEDRTSDLGEPPKLKAEVASFLEGSSEMLDGGSEEVLQELAVSKFSDWVRWKAGECDTPSWWVELLTVLGEDNIRRLAQEVRALFQLPRQMHELEPKEAPFQAPPVPPCLHHQPFMPPVISIYASQDIREIPREKVICICQCPAAFCRTKEPSKEE